MFENLCIRRYVPPDKNIQCCGVDRHRFNTPPDPNFHFYADQDPTSCFTQLGEIVEIFFIFYE
jgi:hypothetical protein